MLTSALNICLPVRRNLSLLALAIAGCAPAGNDEASALAANLRAPYDYYINGMQSTRFDAGGVRLYALHASRATHFPSDDYAELSNPDLLLYKIQQTAYKFSFLLIPLSIPFVALLFLWRRGFTLYDHGVFVLYSLTAMSILVMVTSILAPIWSGFGVLSGLAFAFGVPAHMFAQLKGAYQLSWFSAAWRTMLLLIFCVFALTAFVVSIIMLGLAG